ncbi:MAG: tRNA (adenosine(37)-N6)-threonylcarbamoyltransferase complex ATPase subunit type 1 TsaE [Kiritimatiellae bacterium]|nr:tRNA (adenosine(37)-N6)-threonylcarbamoyltransferase complex ATPase subunit type 1 TsaE [Kiritimatiellia bacterium]
MTRRRHTSNSISETHALADWLLTERPGRLVVALYGELGSGKTCFVQGLALGLGITRPVTSPTFVIINEYRGTRNLYHIDLYRIHNAKEALAIGLDDYLRADGVTAIEWAERVQELLPPDAVHVRLWSGEKPNERQIEILLP